MVYLRLATDADLSLMMAWRSNPDIYQGFYTQVSPLKWEEHLKWWKSRNQDWRSFIIVLVEKNYAREVGVVNIGQLDHWSPEIGYYVGNVTDWGKGIAREALEEAFKWLKERGYKYCHTTIKMDNERSSKLAWGLGFSVVCGAREGELWLTKEL